MTPPPQHTCQWLVERSAPLLTRQEELDLSRRARRGDKAAIAHLVHANIRLVIKIAAAYAKCGGPGCDLDDLASEGLMGCTVAAKRYQPAKHPSAKFSTYAAFWIKQFIRRALTNKSHTIRIPVTRSAMIYKLRKAAAELGDNATPKELAARVGITVHQVHTSRMAMELDVVLSTNTPRNALDGDRRELGDSIVDDQAASPAISADTKDLNAQLRKAIERMPKRTQAILSARFGLDGRDPLPLSAIGIRFGVTRERIRQIQIQAINELRRSIHTQ